jgi:DNA-binding MarR family transcriptional regulator
MPTMTPTLRNLLLSRYELLYERGFATATEHGYGDVTPAMARVFVLVARGRFSISELARRLAISRQSVHETVRMACDMGLVELIEDPENRRVRIVRFTDAGQRMSRTVLSVDRRMERELAGRIGARNVAALKRILAMEW